jgi:hypothetical protein
VLKDLKAQPVRLVHLAPKALRAQQVRKVL